MAISESHPLGTQLLKLDILIVGAGIAGLTAAACCLEKGFNVTVLEYAPQFAHIGAGLMISCNASRVLVDLGLQAALDEVGTHMKRTLFVKHDSGHLISETSYSGVEEELGAPLYQIHRADLHDILLAKAQHLGVKLIMGAAVAEFDGSGPSVKLVDGTVYCADVVVAADGYRSRARGQLLGGNSEPRFSGNAAYRGLVPRNLIEGDAELEALMDMKDQPGSHVWVGAGRHVLCYGIRQGEFLNFVATQPAAHTLGSAYTAKVSTQEVLDSYRGWDPLMLRVISSIPEGGVLEWKLCDIAPMDTWLLPGDKIVLIGDAAHAMLPSAAQGAGMGIEDGAALAEILSRARDHSEIPHCLKAFERLRLPRCTEVVDTGRQNAKKWHAKGEVKGGTVTDSMWNYDVKAAARQANIDT